jgi:putative transposase
MEASDIKKMNGLEDESCQLKQMIADLNLECHSLKNVIEKSLKTSVKARAGQLSDCAVCHELTSGIQILSRSRTVYH